MQWYYSKNGTQLGPVEESELRGKLASGEVSTADLLWREGMPDWQPAAKVAELNAVVPPSFAPPSPGDVTQSPYSPPQSQPFPVYPQTKTYQGPDIPSNLWQAIVVTLFCCLPFGIVSIVYAAKVDGLKTRGDFAGAMSAAASSRTWCNVSILVWAAFLVLTVLINLLASN
ncbi:MAG: CD225/dispanin family protein [Verrucomicrobiota bacterium]